jgi:membrane fusion protein
MSLVTSRAKVPAEQSHAPPAEPEPLFRPEVMQQRQNQWLGTILLEPRTSSTLFIAGATLSALAVLALLFFGSFTRKARVNGWLVPEQGLVRIFAPQAGVVIRMQVHEGVHVEKGAPLIVLSAEVQSDALGATQAQIIRRLHERRDSLSATKEVQDRLFDQQTRDMQQRLAILNTERRSMAREIELQRARLQLTENAQSRTMRARDVLTLNGGNAAEQERIEQTARLQALERQQAAHTRELLELESRLRELPFRRRTQISEYERNVAALDQEVAEAEARRQIVITAPQDGTVTGIQTEAGGNADPRVPLMSIVPADAVLQAELFSPTRAIGFVRPGQRVLLRYQAFPYQKFGFYEGTIRSVSRSAVSPSELSQQLTGLTSLFGANEPVYRVTVDLAQQTVTAYGGPVPLQPGMQLEADVLIESRRLIEWMLEPLFSVTGKMQG